MSQTKEALDDRLFDEEDDFFDRSEKVENSVMHSRYVSHHVG